MRRLGPVLLVVLLGACGGRDSPPAATASSPAAPTDGLSPTPLSAPANCGAESGHLEIWAQGDSWATPKGDPYEAYEACFAVAAEEPFTVTMHNVKIKSLGSESPDHNFSIYSDSVALDRSFYGEPIDPGEDRTFKVPALPAGTYLFRCDFHPNLMKGILEIQ
jgi:Cupredoxin-like domain